MQIETLGRNAVYSLISDDNRRSICSGVRSTFASGHRKVSCSHQVADRLLGQKAEVKWKRMMSEKL